MCKRSCDFVSNMFPANLLIFFIFAWKATQNYCIHICICMMVVPSNYNGKVPNYDLIAKMNVFATNQ